MPPLPTPILYTLLLLSGLLWAVLGLAYKMADQTHCRTAPFSRVFMATCAAVSGLAAWRLEHTPWGDWRLWAMGVAFGVLFYLVILLLMPTYRLGPPSIVWVVVNLGALVPVFLSPFFKEPLYWQLDIGLIALFVITLMVFERGMAQTSDTAPGGGTKFLLALLGVFLANGMLLTGPKLQGHFFGETARFGYLALFYAIGALVTFIFDLVQRKPLAVTRAEWTAGLMAGLSGGLGMMCFMSAMALPAAIAYPVNAGISLVGGVALTTLCYKERLNTLKVAGLALGLMVVLLFSLRDTLAHRFLPAAPIPAVQRQP